MISEAAKDDRQLTRQPVYAIDAAISFSRFSRYHHTPPVLPQWYLYWAIYRFIEKFYLAAPGFLKLCVTTPEMWEIETKKKNRSVFWSLDVSRTRCLIPL